MNKQKVLAAVLAACVAAVPLVGCGKDKKTEGEASNSFTYWATLPDSAASHIQSFNEMTYYQELERRTGVHVKFVHPPAGQAAEQFNLMVASGSDSLYDMIEYNWIDYAGGPDKAVSDGIIIDMTDMLEENAPNISKLFKENDTYRRLSYTDEKRFCLFPMLITSKHKVFGGIMIRKDWLDDLNLKVPETIADWETTLRAFKEQKGATAPLTLSKWQMTGNLGQFNNAFNVGLNMYVDNGKIKYPQMEPGYKEFLTLMNKWYKEGWLDNEYDTNTSSVVDAKMTNGSSGATYGYVGGTIGRYMSAVKDKDPNYALAAAPYPVANPGDEPRFMECTFDVKSPYVGISTNCSDPAGAMKWMDYAYSEEGSILTTFGVEGDTYTKEGDSYVYTDKIMHNPEGLSIAEAMGVNFRANEPAPGLQYSGDDYLKQYYTIPAQWDALETWSKYEDNAPKSMMPPLSSTLEESEEFISLNSEIKTYVEEMLLKFIKGSEPLENYEAFQEQLKSMGVERLVELKQLALDRYNNR